MTIEFELGELRGTVVRSGNVDFNNRIDTYRFSTSRDITGVLLQFAPTGSSLQAGLYQDINSNGLVDSGERSTRAPNIASGEVIYFDNDLGRSDYIVQVATDSDGRAANYSIKFINRADDIVGLNSPAAQPSISGTIGFDNPGDRYAFNTSVPGDISLSFRGTTANAQAGLYEDVNGNRQVDQPDVRLWYDPTVSPGEVISVNKRVSAGDYIIGVGVTDGSRQTNYEFSLSGPPGADLRSNNSSSASGGTVYRVYDFLTGAHFYTANASERNTRITDGRYRDEGASFDSAGVNTVERFYNPTTQTYFYTINPAERDAVLNSLPNYQYQPGQGFQASAAPVPGSTPLYRFFNTLNGVHFYTPNAAEAQNVRNTLPNFRDEGVGFYVDPLG
jgi:hypothetical protein